MLDTQTYLPAALPSPGVVESVNPVAGDAIRSFREFDASLPPRRSAEQINEVERLRSEALAQLGDDFFAALRLEEEEILDGVRDVVTALSSKWGRLEAIRGLRNWRERPLNFTPIQIPVLTVPTGNGYSKVLTGREVLLALRETVGDR